MTGMAPDHDAESDLGIVTYLQTALTIEYGAFPNPDIFPTFEFFRGQDFRTFADPATIGQPEKLRAFAIRHQFRRVVSQNLRAKSRVVAAEDIHTGGTWWF